MSAYVPVEVSTHISAIVVTELVSHDSMFSLKDTVSGGRPREKLSNRFDMSSTPVVHVVVSSLHRDVSSTISSS